MISITDKKNCLCSFSLEQEKLLVSLCPLEDKETCTCSVKSELLNWRNTFHMWKKDNFLLSCNLKVVYLLYTSFAIMLKNNQLI